MAEIEAQHRRLREFNLPFIAVCASRQVLAFRTVVFLLTLSAAASQLQAQVAATPAFSPAAGTYTAAQSVMLTSTTSGATIYYTTDGTAPSPSSSQYSGPITVSASETIQAFAVAPGYTNSSVGSAAYAIYPYGVITTIAGNGIVGYGGDGGAATSAELNYARKVAVDGNGTVYIADTYNCRVRKIAGGVITTVAGTGTAGFSGDGGAATSAQLAYPWGVAIDGSGNLYIADNANMRVRKVTPAGIISTYAGNGVVGFSGDGGPATNAELRYPYGVALDPSGNLYIADSGNYRVRKVTPAGIISTIAGNGTAGFSGDGGAGTSAEISAPNGVAADSNGNVYIADLLNYRIRKVTVGGTISTVAGTGTSGSSADGGLATGASLTYPVSVTADNNGNIYLDDVGSSRVRKVNAAGIISTVVGNGVQGFGGDGGLATLAEVNSPQDVAVDGIGNLYIPDYVNQRIRKITYQATIPPPGQADTPTISPGTGTYTTIQNVTLSDGTSGVSFYYTTDGTVPTTSSTLYTGAITVSASETIQAIAVPTTGTTSAVASATYTVNLMTQPPIILPAAATYAQPQTITMSSVTSGATIFYTTDGSTPTTSSTVYSAPFTLAASETIQAIASSSAYGLSTVTTAAYTYNPSLGTINTIAGSSTAGFSGDGGAALSATLNNAAGLVLDSIGNLYIADNANHRIRKVTPAGIISTVAGNGTAGYSGDGGAATSAALHSPQDMVVDGVGNLYIADTGNNVVRKVTPAGIISTIAGTGSAGYSGDGGSATNAMLNFPRYVTLDTGGNLYISDAFNSRVRKVTPAGIISTYAGNGISGFSGDGGIATNAAFSGNIDGLAFDNTGNLYISDVANARIRMVTAAGIISTYAGDGTQGSSGDGAPAINAAIEDPEAITIDLSGNIYVGSYGAYVVRKITPAGLISTVAGGGSSLAEGVAATFASLAAGFGVAVDSAGSIYVTSLNEVRKVTYGPATQVATPVIAPATGTYTSLQTATITDVTPGAVIFYTTDGSTPTQASTRYTGAISVVASETVNAFAVSSGYIDSLVANSAIVISVPTSVALTSSKNPSLFGDSLTFTGVVSPSNSGNQVPTGTLIFTDGSTPLGTAVLSQGVVFGSISTSALAGGAHSINVSYSGDATFSPSTSTITQQVNPIAPTITWATPVAIATGTPLSAIQQDAAAKSPISGASVPGTYQYTPASGTVLSAGQQILSVTFTPTDQASYTTATATVSLTVAQAPTTTLTVTSAGGAVNTVASGGIVTLTAAVAYPVTTGQINFCDATAANCTDIHLLGTAQLTSAGTAAMKFIPGIGNHSYKAVFIATINYPSSVSAAAPLAVTGTYPTLTTINSTGSPGSYTLTAATTGVGSNALSPTGVVSFLDTSYSNMSLGTATLGGVTDGFGFVSSSTPATGIYPDSGTVGDFNGDGKLDLAVANIYSNSLTILLGNGDGTFTPAASPATGTNPYSVAATDFNGDGKLDLAVTNYGSNTVTVLLGNGDGTFSVAPSPPTGAGPSFLRTGDFNGDGKPDLVVANQAGNTLTVLLGNGDGTFTLAPSPQTGGNPAQIAVGDFNGDGKPDLAITYGLSKTVTILLGNGDGTFTSATGLSTSAYPTGVATGDFNGDGKPDLAVSEVNTLNIFTGNGDGTFTAGAVLTVNVLPSSATVGDFNGDGKVDLALASGGSATPTILLGNGDGTFKVASTSIPPGSTSSTFIVAGDFNGDGIADVVFPDNISSSHTTTGNLRVFLAQLTSTATATATGVSPITPGVHNVVASYAGDTNFNASTSAATALTIPSLMLTSFTPNTGQLGDSAKTITITGVGFVAGTLAQVNGANIATTIVNSTTLTAIVPASYFNAIGSLQITLSNSAAGEMTAAFPLTVTTPTVAATITAPNTSAPGTQPAVTFSLGAAYPLPLIATFTLNDRSAIASGAVDPAVQFATGGTTYTVTIPAGVTTIPVIPVQAGTIAATITVPVTLTANGINVTPGTLAATIVVPAAVPDVTATTLARSGKTLTITESGFSNTREIVSASFHFTPVAGATLTTSDFTAPVGQDFATWFADSTSLSYGSAFSYTQIFNVSDDASKIASVQVTLTNSVGVSTTETAQ